MCLNLGFCTCESGDGSSDPSDWTMSSSDRGTESDGDSGESEWRDFLNTSPVSALEGNLVFNSSTNSSTSDSD